VDEIEHTHDHRGAEDRHQHGDDGVLLLPGAVLGALVLSVFVVDQGAAVDGCWWVLWVLWVFWVGVT
jgi:hypothetical protein